MITGAAGFIGFHSSKKLLELNLTVVGIDNLNDYYDTGLKYGRLAELGIEKKLIGYGKPVKSSKYKGFSFIKLDLTDASKVAELFATEKFDAVINLAAQPGIRYSLENPASYVNSNVVGFLNILEGCRHHNVKHLIYASSSSVYGSNKKIPFSVDDRVDTPISLYAATKKSNELMAYSYSHLFGIPLTGLRFFTVYGPWGRPDMAYYKFAKKIMNGEPIDVYNNGRMRRDFTYIDDICAGISRLLNKIPGEDSNGVKYKLYNIGNNKPEELMHFISILEDKIGQKAKINFMPMQPGDVLETYADIDGLINDIGFKPSTPIEEGLAKFIDWMNEEKF